MLLLHDVSQTGLAAAVMVLGLVILLELRAIARLRRTMDLSLARVFEQLDLVRADTQQLIEAQALASAAPAKAPARTPGAGRPEEAAAQAPVLDAYASAATLASHGMEPEEIATRCGLPAGEARLLASLASARARRAKSGQGDTTQLEAGQRASAGAAARPVRAASVAIKA